MNISERRSISTTCTVNKRLVPDMHDPERINHVFVAAKPDERPMENIPFVKSLFKGEFDKVRRLRSKYIIRYLCPKL